MLSECNGRLYCLWKQFGDLETGDTLNCCDPAILGFTGGANADIYMSVSMSLDGSLWDKGRNLTPNTTPDCDTTAGNECDHHSYASASRYGMNTKDFEPTYWSSVPEVFDVRNWLEPTYPDDSIYLDVQYVNDLFPENARYNTEIWTLNPIKWFRLPCVEPVVAPRILISQDDFIHPAYWVKSGQEVNLDVTVENIGNDTLHVDSIKAENQDPAVPAWVAVSPTSLTIDPASDDITTVDINDGGLINPAPGTAVAISADIVFYSDDPDNPAYTFGINTVVADTVVEPAWDTITTGMGMALTVCNQGGAGNVGIGGVNMDFFGPDSERIQPPYADCDTTQVVYLYDLCPIVMKSVSDYSWGPFWTPERAADHNFQPIPSSAPKVTEATGFTRYSSGTFVTHDTSIYMVKHWIAPTHTAPYMIERIDLWSETGVQNDVRVGEWIDWDIPSDTGVNNEGGIGSSGDYLWQRGLTYGELDPTPCTWNEDRYGASGLLGWYYDSEYELDSMVNHTDGLSGLVALDDDIFENGADETFLPDSVWKMLNSGELAVNNAEAGDQQVVLGFGSFQIRVGDTLHIYVLHVSEYDGGLDSLAESVDSAKAWYIENRSAWIEPPGLCGDLNGSGHVTLSDITYLVAYLYLGGPAPDPIWVADLDLCDGITIADIELLIDYWLGELAFPPCEGWVNCDYAPEGDSVEVWVVNGSGQQMWMDLYVRNTGTAVGGSMGFSWQDPDLRLDSARAAYPLITNGFDMGTHLYENGSLAASNAHQRFPFGGSRQEGEGVPGDSTKKRLWARYYFTYTGKDAKDDPVIDTTTFDDGSKYLVVEEDSLGYNPAWTGAFYRHECCGLYAGGLTGNTNADPDGKRNLADVTRLIDRIYVTPDVPLMCEPSGNTDGDPAGKLNLTDITRIIDHLYVSLVETAPCP
jgi:hypothetical protein